VDVVRQTEALPALSPSGICRNLRDPAPLLFGKALCSCFSAF
jgi:hypothetical protein